MSDRRSAPGPPSRLRPRTADRWRTGGGRPPVGYDRSRTAASIAATTSGGSGPAVAAATHSRSSWRFFTPSTTVAIPGIDSA